MENRLERQQQYALTPTRHMKSIRQYISAMLAILMSVALSSCSSNSDSPSPASKMSISFRVETRNSGKSTRAEESAGVADGYEDATEWENFIDIDRNDYRIAFFDNNNRCITPFTPKSISAVEESNYVEYTLEGEVPAILTMYSDFKIVVLANWGVGNYPVIVAGSTTLGDLCCPPEGTLARFRHFESSDYQITQEQQRYVPMYGVKEYKGVVFGKDNQENPTILYQGNFGPVNMLRAIAKVELIFNTSDILSLDTEKDIYITNYNDYGYCAPEGAFSERDYYNNRWESDYWRGHLHLVGGSNDAGPAKTLKMKKLSKDGKDVWVAYLPEYRNVDLAENEKDCENSNVEITSETEIRKARIAVPHVQRGIPKISYIDFATHVDGEPTDPFNIERNNLYRFTVTHVDQGITWKVEALPWNCLQHEEIVM